MRFVDPSSIVTWVCYAAGLTCENAFAADRVRSSHIAALMMALTVVVFFAVVLLVQRYMGVALRARSFASLQRLVTTGPFRWSRNPIYAAFLIPLAALAFVSPAIAVCTVTLYVAAMNLFVIRHEERNLLALFGDEYREYARRTPRWLVI